MWQALLSLDTFGIARLALLVGLAGTWEISHSPFLDKKPTNMVFVQFTTEYIMETQSFTACWTQFQERHTVTTLHWTRATCYPMKKAVSHSSNAPISHGICKERNSCHSNSNGIGTRVPWLLSCGIWTSIGNWQQTSSWQWREAWQQVRISWIISGTYSADLTR